VLDHCSFVWLLFTWDQCCDKPETEGSWNRGGDRVFPLQLVRSPRSIKKPQLVFFREPSCSYHSTTMSIELFPNHNWTPFLKSKTVKCSINLAVQIQYIVKNSDQQTIIQGFNIFSGFNSGPHLQFDIQHFPLLKLVTIKQWILAITYEKQKNTLESRYLSLLSGYILYYEKVLDRVVDGEIELRMEIEHSCGGVHTSAQNIVDLGEQEWDMEECIKASASSWSIGNIYRMHDPTKASKHQIDKVVKKVLHWLSLHFDQYEDVPHLALTSGPPPPIKKTIKKGEPRYRQGQFQTRSGGRKYKKMRFDSEDEVEKLCTYEHFQ